VADPPEMGVQNCVVFISNIFATIRDAVVQIWTGSNWFWTANWAMVQS